MASEEKGVWRTIGGRRVFIKDGQSLADAMIESGKFKNDLRSSYVKAKEEDKKKKEEKKEFTKEELKEKYGTDDVDLINAGKEKENRVSLKEESPKLSEKQIEAGNRLNEKGKEMAKSDIQTYLSGNKENWDSDEDFIRDLASEYGLDKEEAQNLFKNVSEQEKQREKGNPLEKMANDRIKEKENTLNNDKMLLESMKKKGLNEINGTTQEELENKIKKNEEYLKVATSPQEEKVTLTKEELQKRIDRENKKEEEYKEKVKSENFISQSTNPFYADKEYSKEDLKKMEESGVKPMKNTYSGNGWEGVNSNKNLTTSEQAKAITSAMKEKYPNVEIARKSSVYSGGSSITFSVMSSDKDLYISDKDIDNLSTDKLYNSEITRGWGFERWANDNVPNYRTEHTFTDKDVKNYAKQSLAELKKRDNQSVRGDEWYLSDYGKEVMKELNKQADSYTYDDSDAMTDYFNHGTYMWVNIGKYDKPYQVKESKSTKSSGNQVTNSLQQKAYEKYKREHPNSKLTFEQFKKEQD